MSMFDYERYIVKYRCKNEDGTETSFNAADFKSKWKARRFMRRKRRKASPNETYELYDQGE